MTKIRSIQFKNHPILGNLYLDFCLPNGKAADTIIIAGENGAGKSILLDSLYNLITGKIDFEIDVNVDFNSNDLLFSYYDTYANLQKRKHIQVKVSGANIPLRVYNPSDSSFQSNFGMYALCVDAETSNRAASPISQSTKLDATHGSNRTAINSEEIIVQTLVDINALDNADLAITYKARQQAGLSTDNIPHDTRMRRFTTAFDSIFDGLRFCKVDTSSYAKSIYFEKFGKEIPLYRLSSGEKQIIFRGGFLLKDKNANKGAFVFIDEPEKALHPNWQKKILNFYRNIFSDAKGNQTSQLFIVTHSPFIIHGKQPINDKVLVLKRDEGGNVIVLTSPEYDYCSSLKAIEDAFNIRDFSSSTPTIYLEGRTDELYFKKALELSGITDFPFIFKWVGHIDTKGQEANTGKEALKKAYQFLIGANPSTLHICLSDCDTKHKSETSGNVMARCIPQYENHQAKISAGIENALVISEEMAHPYRTKKSYTDQYGNPNVIFELDKMALCKHICDELSPDEQLPIFQNLIKELDVLLNEYQQNISITKNA